MPLSSSQYPEVELPSPVITQQQVTSSAYQITDVNDNPVQKTVVARVTVGPGAINFFTVWSGESYDQIGQWTDSDLVAAVTPLVQAAYPPVTP
jgi:glutamine synthetase